jgi:hypothetical protein
MCFSLFPEKHYFYHTNLVKKKGKDRISLKEGR